MSGPARLFLRRRSASSSFVYPPIRRRKRSPTFVRFARYDFMDLAMLLLGPISGAFPAMLRGPRRRCVTVSLACSVSLSLCFVRGLRLCQGQLCLCVGPSWDPNRRSLLRPHECRGDLYFMSRKKRGLRGLFSEMGVGYRVRVNMARAVLFA